jgi:ankyrin repeat protein
MADEQKGDFIATAKALIEIRAMLEARDNAGLTPFHLACAAGNLDMVKFLFESGSDPNTVDNQGFTPLHTAAQKGHASLVPYLLEVSNHDVLQ